MKYKIPDEIFGKKVNGAIERVFSQKGNDNQINRSDNIQLPSKFKDFIYVPSIDLYVAKEKILFNHNWQDTHNELQKTHNGLQKNNLRMYTPQEAKAFLDYLSSKQSSGTSDASISEIEKIIDEILTKRDPWRAEWIDAYFEKKKDGLYILTKNKTNSEKLEPCIMKDCYTELDSFNKQGFPTKESKVQEYKKGENIYFWYPKNGAVAGFYADSGRASFDCDRLPSGSSGSLGVRSCAEGTTPKN